MTDLELQEFLDQYMKDSERSINLCLVSEKDIYRMIDGEEIYKDKDRDSGGKDSSVDTVQDLEK